MYRSQTCVDWFLTFKVKKKKKLQFTVIIVMYWISKLKRHEINVKKKTVLEVWSSGGINKETQ